MGCLHLERNVYVMGILICDGARVEANSEWLVKLGEANQSSSVID